MDKGTVMWVIGVALTALYAVIGFGAKWVRDVANLLRRTREDYVTKEDCAKFLATALAQVDRDQRPVNESLGRIEAMIAANEERSGKTRHDMRDAQNRQGLQLERMGAQLDHQKEAIEKVTSKVDTLQVNAVAAATAAATRVIIEHGVRA